MPTRSSLATFATLVTLTGCASAPDADVTDSPSDDSTAQAIVGGRASRSCSPRPTPPARTVDQNLQALRDLQVFEVRGVLVDIPENANCYNLPCPGHESEFVSREEADRRAAANLDRFTRTAVAAAADVSLDDTIATTGHCYDTDAQNLDALKALRMVSLGDLVLEAPGQNPNCYYAPFGPKLARIAAAFRKP
ncbi:MAG: hypothetical protein U0169_04255 [Polyangiaceae bacterium]